MNAVPQPSPRWAWQQWLQRNWAEIHGIEGDSRIVNLYIYIYQLFVFLLGVIELFLDLLEGFFLKNYFGDCLPAERSFAQKWRNAISKMGTPEFTSTISTGIGWRYVSGPAMKTREALWRLAFGCGLGHYHRCGMVPGGVSWRQDGNFVSGNGRNGYEKQADCDTIPRHSYWKWPFIVDFPIKNGDFQ